MLIKLGLLLRKELADVIERHLFLGFCDSELNSFSKFAHSFGKFDVWFVADGCGGV